MKTCPVCNESFINEMNFCDVDGSPLDRDPVTSAQIKSRLWSFLGVGLLIGALGLSLTVVLMPKRRPTPAMVSPESSLTASTPPPASPEPATSSRVPATSAESESEAANGSISSEVRPRERTTDNLKAVSGPAPNPKAAALDTREADTTVRRTEPVEQPIALKPEPARAPKSVAPPSDGDLPKTVRTTDAKKETASQPVGSKTDKETKKKPDEKKKGGFFRVFKKIFGKD
jgi:hypothetical protein